MPIFVTTNLRFPEATWRELRLQAARRRTTAAGLVREAVERYLGRGGAGGPPPSDGDPFDRHIGAITGSAGDESVNHDHYLYGWPKETNVKLLADSSALLALVMRDDHNHAVAKEFARRNPSARFVLSELILAEVVTRARAWAGAAVAVGLGRDLLRSRRYELVFVDAELIEGALARMERYGDKRLSLTDCASFEIMERLGLEAAFTFDRDFQDCGLRTLPGLRHEVNQTPPIAGD